MKMLLRYAVKEVKGKYDFFCVKKDKSMDALKRVRTLQETPSKKLKVEEDDTELDCTKKCTEWLFKYINHDDKVMVWMLSKSSLLINRSCYPSLLFRDHALVAVQFSSFEKSLVLKSPQDGNFYSKKTLNTYAMAMLHHLSVLFQFGVTFSVEVLDDMIAGDIRDVADFANHSEQMKPYVINAINRQVSKMTRDEMLQFKNDMQGLSAYPDSSFETQLFHLIQSLSWKSCLCATDNQPHTFTLSDGKMICQKCSLVDDNTPNGLDPNLPAHWMPNASGFVPYR